MHTTGEPTRIIYQGYPQLSGTLLEQRTEAQNAHDYVRRKLMLEPRGHSDMYGAILRPDTEHTRDGTAHMGVLFLTNEGYSTMCGHATIALSRFLVDTHDLKVFPRRDEVRFDHAANSVSLSLHAPCGIVDVTIPTSADGSRSDPSRPVSHISVPSFATGVQIKIDIPEQFRWLELNGRESVTADFSYGGAFYCLISTKELGFDGGLRKNVELSAMNLATKKLKAAINANPSLKYLFTHPDHQDLGFLYSVIVTDASGGVRLQDSYQTELGLCFFAAQQIDRSPTGSGVAARVALAFAKDRSTRNIVTTYHSLVSEYLQGRGGFIGRLHEEIGEHNSLPIVRARVEGFASYTGTSTFYVEETDPLGDDGFLFDRLC